LSRNENKILVIRKFQDSDGQKSICFDFLPWNIFHTGKPRFFKNHPEGTPNEKYRLFRQGGFFQIPYNL